MELKSRKKSPQKFHCDCCDYYTSKKSDFDRSAIIRRLKERGLSVPKMRPKDKIRVLSNS